jgi:hypothetical protein
MFLWGAGSWTRPSSFERSASSMKPRVIFSLYVVFDRSVDS